MTRPLSAMLGRILCAEASVVGRQAAVPSTAARRHERLVHPRRSSRKSRSRADDIRGTPGQDGRPPQCRLRMQGARMTRSRPITPVAGAAVLALTALAAAACGGGSTATAATQAPKRTAAQTSKPAARHAPTVRLAETRLGTILVDSRGRTLY